MSTKTFIGINLGGGGSSRTSIAVFKKLPKKDSREIELLNIYPKVGNSKRLNSDKEINAVIKKANPELIAINSPLSLPPCFECKSSCKKSKICKNSKAKYLELLSQENRKMKMKGKKYLPYMHRPCDAFIRNKIDSSLSGHEPMSANMAPIMARGYYLNNFLLHEIPFIEVYPKLSLVMLRSNFRLLKKQVLAYTSILNGKFYRKHLLEVFESELGVRINPLDSEELISCSENFSAFINGYTAYLYMLNNYYKKPSDFPRGASWIVFPNES